MENLQAASRTFPRLFYSPEKINLPEVHPPDVISLNLSKITSATDSIKSRLYLWSPLSHQVISYFKYGQRFLFHCKQLQKIADITPAIKSTIQIIIKDRNV